jgi:hypothetical protein
MIVRFSHWHNSWEPAYLLTNAKEAIEEYNSDRAMKLIEESRLSVEKTAKDTYNRGLRTRAVRKRGEINTASAYIYPLSVLLNTLTIQ